MGPDLLEVRDLSAWYPAPHGKPTLVLDRLNLSIRAGEAVGICGVSGGGKSTLARILLRLGAAEFSGAMHFGHEDIAHMTAPRLRQLRGGEIGLVPQEPSAALNPVRRVEAQVAEVLQAHAKLSRKQARAEALQRLRGLLQDDAPRVAASYPHQLSSGQRQRVVIAQALAGGAALLIADEPTSTLDSITQFELLTLFQKLRAQTGMALLLMSHNLAALAFCADRVLTLEGGRLHS